MITKAVHAVLRCQDQRLPIPAGMTTGTVSAPPAGEQVQPEAACIYFGCYNQAKVFLRRNSRFAVSWPASYSVAVKAMSVIAQCCCCCCICLSKQLWQSPPAQYCQAVP